MIISHRYRFIMIKTAKTAGSSLEIALSKYLGPDDVITPLLPDDEQLRSQLGYQGTQNQRIAFPAYSRSDLAQLFLQRKRLRYPGHAPATFIRKHVAREVWGGYYKFAFERNPWDKAISAYWFRMRNVESPPPVSEYLAMGLANNVPGYDLYTVDNRLAVDRVFLYEELEQSIAELTEVVGLPEIPELPRANASFRKDHRHYRDTLDTEARAEIAIAYAREIARFGYRY